MLRHKLYVRIDPRRFVSFCFRKSETKRNSGGKFSPHPPQFFGGWASFNVIMLLIGLYQ